MTFCTFRLLGSGAGNLGLVSQLRRGWGLSYEPREWQAAGKRMSDSNVCQEYLIQGIWRGGELAASLIFDGRRLHQI